MEVSVKSSKLCVCVLVCLSILLLITVQHLEGEDNLAPTHFIRKLCPTSRTKKNPHKSEMSLIMHSAFCKDNVSVFLQALMSALCHYHQGQ